MPFVAHLMLVMPRLTPFGAHFMLVMLRLTPFVAQLMLVMVLNMPKQCSFQYILFYMLFMSKYNSMFARLGTDYEIRNQ